MVTVLQSAHFWCIHVPVHVHCICTQHTLHIHSLIFHTCIYNYVSAGESTLNIHNITLALRDVNDWNGLGVALNIAEYKLEEIKINNLGQVQACKVSSCRWHCEVKYCRWLCAGMCGCKMCYSLAF